MTSASKGTPPNLDTLGRSWRLCLKELRESLRDRRTLTTLIVMPLLVYPILSITFQRFLLTTANSSVLEVLIGVAREADMDVLESLLKAKNGKLPRGSQLPEEFRINLVAMPNLEQAVRDRTLDVGVEMAPLEPGPKDRIQSPIACRLIHNKGSYRAEVVADWLAKRLAQLNQGYMRTRLVELGESGLLPAQVQREEISVQNSAAQSLATLVPLVLILMTVTGAVYPAIDLTAGERERGTLEALVAAPVPRLGLLFAKYIAVMTVAILTATANMVAMMITLYSAGLVQQVFDREGMPWWVVAVVFGLMILFASFFSAVLLAATSFARSFKEAQAYIVPIILFSLAPCLVCLAPGIEMNGMLAVTPLVNIVLLARDVFSGSVNWQLVPLVIISTGMYASAAIGVAARIFGSDAILYGSQTGVRELFLTTNPDQRVPSLSGATFFLALLFPVYVLLANGLAVWAADRGIESRLMLSGMVTIILFAVWPIFVLWLLKLDVRRTLRLLAPPWPCWAGAALLGFSLWPMMHELVVFSHFGGTVVDGDQFDVVQDFVKALQAISPGLVLFALAIVPAVCEELFFRGFLLSAFLDRLKPWQAIVLSGLLFGLFHVLAKSALAVERMLPSTLVGLVLGWVCYRSRSLFPGIALHALHNGILTMVAHQQDMLASRGWDILDRKHLPAVLLIVSVVGTILGWLLIWRSTKPQQEFPDQPTALKPENAIRT